MNYQRYVIPIIVIISIILSCQYENAEELYYGGQNKLPSDTTQNDTVSKTLLVDIPFNNAAEDISDNQTDVVVHGDVFYTSDRYGNSNSALYLEGENQYIELDLKQQDSISVSLWFNCSSGMSNYSSLFDYGSNAVRTDIDGLSGPTSFFITSFYNNIDELNADFYFQFYTWYHIYISACGSPVIYVNGEKVGEIRKNIVLNLTSTNIVFGKSVLDDTQSEKYFRGIIDDIKIFNYALSENEIKELANMSIVK